MKQLFLHKNSKFQNDKNCSSVEGTLNIGNLSVNLINILRKKVKTLLFNKSQFSIVNYLNKCNTVLIELNDNFLDTLKINTGNTDSSLADNGVMPETQDVKTIAAYFEQMEFVNSPVEPNTSTLKLKDNFLKSLTKNTDRIFENNSLAILGGLNIGDNYRTSIGQIMIVY